MLLPCLRTCRPCRIPAPEHGIRHCFPRRFSQLVEGAPPPPEKVRQNAGSGGTGCAGEASPLSRQKSPAGKARALFRRHAVYRSCTAGFLCGYRLRLFPCKGTPASLYNGVIRLYGGRLLLQEKRMTTTSRPSSSPQALRFPILRPAFSCMAGSIRAHASWTAPAPLVPSVSRRKRIRADTSPSSQIFCLRRSEKPLTYFFRRTDGSYPYSCTHPYPRHKRNRRYW